MQAPSDDVAAVRNIGDDHLVSTCGSDHHASTFPKMTAVYDKRLRVLSQHLAHGGSCQHGNSNSHSQLQLLVQPEVQRALKAGKAVVALESTIISHGLHILCFTVYLFTIINQLHAAACRHAIPTEC